MGDFQGEGYDPFPNSFLDNQRISECSEWTDEVIEHKVREYWAFLTRRDIQPRARGATERILTHLGFEMDYREGFYITGDTK